MYRFDKSRLDLAREFKTNPFGEHSPDLQYLLHIMRQPGRAPGKLGRFVVRGVGGPRAAPQRGRWRRPAPGPPPPPSPPEPVSAPCNGSRSGRRQTIPIGSLAIIPAHEALALTGSFTIAAY